LARSFGSSTEIFHKKAKETNVDTLAHPGRSGTDESVRSRYPLQVGEIDAVVISDGTMSIPASVLAVNAAPTDLEAWLDDMFLPPRFGWPVNVGVVHSGGRTVLIDGGLGAEFPGFPGAGKLPRRLEAAGIDLESLTDVVLTHMHMDHIGGLLGHEVTGRLRPDLRVHVAAAEAEFWAGKADLSHASMPPGVPDALRSVALRVLNEYGSRLQPFEKEHEVAPGVVVSRTGGHTPGHSVVRLESGGTRLMFGGDAMFPCGIDRPGWHNGFDQDPEETVRVRVDLLRELASTRQPLVPCHVLPCHVTVTRDVFRWVPAYLGG
jgi:glyoxylase-like metal-dependent hydrolase (beta-lactamase superfamily II)